MKKSDRTRQEILDATASSLATVGYTATTVKSIADSIGMQDASIYYHFSSKDELVGQVLDIGTSLAVDAVDQALAGLPDEHDPREALRVAIVAHAEAVLGGGDYPRANVRSFGQLPPGLVVRHRKGHRDYGQIWTRLIDDGVESGALRSDLNRSVARLIIIGALCWAIEWFDAGETVSATEVGEHVFQMVVNGLAIGESQGLTVSV
jgi:TetR/AcrR family transcriptional regulator, cholesterol catabolism regulator